MLRKIQIQNYAIIQHLDISFADGLTIITGETGAGKSILLGALGLVMGKRADTKVLFDDTKKCFVEVVFDISEYAMHSFFEEKELDYHEELMIRREIAPGGKSRAFVNDSPVTLDILASLTEGLIDVHQQFDILDIQRPAFQLSMIDALAGNTALMAEYSVAFKAYRQKIHHLTTLKVDSENAAKEIEFLTFQKEEFDLAALKRGEEEELEGLLNKLTSAEDIKKNATLWSHVLHEDEHAIIGQIQMLLNQWSGIKNVDTQYGDLYDRMMSAKEELADISREASMISEQIEYDEEAIAITTARLDVISRLQKKHHVANMGDLLAVQSSILDRLGGFADLSEQVAQIELDIQVKEVELQKQAMVLRENRKSVVAAFETKIHELLISLSMEHAYIKVVMQDLKALHQHGLDDINILFAPNKGSEFLPLKDTASGGEMSRLTLCIKSLVAGAMTLPTLVFDEIDAGISGDVAQKMGAILSDLSVRHQVICITHSPQIAARAHMHFWVHKSDTDTRTLTAMKELTKDERVIEIAKMLSGNPPTEAAKANAIELMNA
ncbi:MAG: DNA repair protein RecN [Saprospiraceae bacterium]